MVGQAILGLWMRALNSVRSSAWWDEEVCAVIVESIACIVDHINPDYSTHLFCCKEQRVTPGGQIVTSCSKPM